MNVTPHDIAQLALTRRRDPDLAMLIAEQSGRQTDQGLKEAPAPRPQPQILSHGGRNG